MSYSVDLWNSYNKLEQQLESHLNPIPNPQSPIPIKNFNIKILNKN